MHNILLGGLILLRPNASAPLQYAASAAFLAKIYKDYLSSVGTLGVSCSNLAESFSLDMLHTFSMSQACASYLVLVTLSMLFIMNYN